ncbi:MAG: hypothetical protein C0608_01545 [Deltaproteobacteria bacterium]|nr:MAG: hypothetical protein C0608_01545 [Deltaproteobacteria bacterium]
MRKELLTLLGALAVASTAFAHQAPIELRTFADGDADGIGDSILQNLDYSSTISYGETADAMVKGPAMSAKQSCDLCHDYEGITSAYHFQLGADEMVDADGDGFKDEVGDILTGEGGLLETLPTLKNITSPGQYGGW